MGPLGQHSLLSASSRAVKKLSSLADLWASRIPPEIRKGFFILSVKMYAAFVYLLSCVPYFNQGRQFKQVYLQLRTLFLNIQHTDQ